MLTYNVNIYMSPQKVELCIVFANHFVSSHIMTSSTSWVPKLLRHAKTLVTLHVCNFLQISNIFLVLNYCKVKIVEFWTAGKAKKSNLKAAVWALGNCDRRFTYF